VFVPQTPTPAPTLTLTIAPTQTTVAVSSPTAALTSGTETTPAVASTITWDNSIGALLQTKCGICHGTAATAGLNLSTYADAMKGGNSGPAIVPGDAANSLIVQKQQAGGHPGQLTPEEIANLIEWINAGAFEK
jgi:mono/diheme cytochrome c family protein